MVICIVSGGVNKIPILIAHVRVSLTAHSWDRNVNNYVMLKHGVCNLRWQPREAGSHFWTARHRAQVALTAKRHPYPKNSKNSHAGA